MGHISSLSHCILVLFQLCRLFFFSFSLKVSFDEICLLFSLCEQFLMFLHGLVFKLPLFCYLYIFAFFFSVLIALMVLSTVLPPYSLTLFQHGKLSTTANSTHFPLHPSCLLSLPVVSKHRWLQVSTVL